MLFSIQTISSFGIQEWRTQSSTDWVFSFLAYVPNSIHAMQVFILCEISDTAWESAPQGQKTFFNIT